MSENFLKMCEIYVLFADGFGDFSEKAKQEMYDYETYGKGELQTEIFTDKEPNGYAHGKKYMDVTVAMWIEDILDGYLQVGEIYKDPKYPRWWLDKIFSDIKPRKLKYISSKLKEWQKQTKKTEEGDSKQ